MWFFVVQAKLLLNVVHRVSDAGQPSDALNGRTTPTRDLVEDFLAFNPEDVVQLTARNVDLCTTDNTSASQGASKGILCLF